MNKKRECTGVRVKSTSEQNVLTLGLLLETGAMYSLNMVSNNKKNKQTTIRVVNLLINDLPKQRLRKKYAEQNNLFILKSI